MTDYKELQRRCQRGEVSLIAANNLLAQLYGAMGALIAENECLGIELKDFQWGAKVEADAGDEARAEVVNLKSRIREVAMHCATVEIERDNLRSLSGELYQVLGALDAPENVLDQVLAAANHDPLPYESLLPFFTDDIDR